MAQPSGWYKPYKVVSIRKSKPPAGSDKKDWYRYVIGQGKDRIVGLRRGSRQSVEEAAEGVVFCLNERLRGKSGRVHIKYQKK